LINVPGIVSLEANSEESELLVEFNTDQVSLEGILAQITLAGDEVTDWEWK